VNHGSIRKRSSEVSEVGDAPAEERNLAVRERRKRRPGEKPEAGDCDWAVRGAEERRQGTSEEIELKEREILEESSPHPIFVSVGTTGLREPALVGVNVAMAFETSMPSASEG
jgi:hypothetical protein